MIPYGSKLVIMFLDDDLLWIKNVGISHDDNPLWIKPVGIFPDDDPLRNETCRNDP